MLQNFTRIYHITRYQHKNLCLGIFIISEVELACSQLEHVPIIECQRLEAHLIEPPGFYLYILYKNIYKKWLDFEWNLWRAIWSIHLWVYETGTHLRAVKFEVEMFSEVYEQLPSRWSSCRSFLEGSCMWSSLWNVEWLPHGFPICATLKIVLLLRNDRKWLDDGGDIPKSQGRRLAFDSWLWNLLHTSRQP